MSNKILCVIGGSGYVGSTVIKHALNVGLTVNCGTENNNLT